MTREETQVGDRVKATGWLGRTVVGVVIHKGKRALVGSQATRGSYKYEKLELIGRTSDVLRDAAREFVEKVQDLVMSPE